MSDRDTSWQLLLEFLLGGLVCGAVVGVVAFADAHPLAVASTLALPLIAGAVWVYRGWKGSLWSYVRFVAAAVGFIALVLINVLLYCNCV